MPMTLVRGGECCHRPDARQILAGNCQVDGQVVRRSAATAGWPDQLDVQSPKVAEEAFRGQVGDRLELHAGVPGRSRAWETAPVSNVSVREENLRKALEEKAVTPEHYCVTSTPLKGEAMQQPRRLRAMVAHLRVTLGHLSNDRLAGVLSGARESVVQLARGLRCQVCAAVRPPQATPQVAYMKPKHFNERVSGDSFHIWGHKGDKYVVTHYIDALTDYHVGDLSLAGFLVCGVWPPDMLVTDGGLSAGHD